MLKHIINKSLILLILTLVPFTSCKKEKICDVDNLVQRVYAGEDVSIFENALNCRVGEDVKNMSAWEINFPKQSYLIGTTYVNYVPGKYPLTYLWFYCDKSDYSKGLIVLQLSKYRKIKGNGSNKKIIDTYSLKDYVLVPGFSSNITHFENVSYGEPRFGQAYIKHYNKEGAGEIEYVGEPSISYDVDENIYGIYAYEGKYPPYNKKVKPKYLVYVENNKLVVEEPKDDKYFIYRIPEL